MTGLWENIIIGPRVYMIDGYNYIINTVILWRVTMRVTSRKLVGVASVIRVWYPMVYEAFTPDSWRVMVVSGKPWPKQVKVTSSPAAAVT